VDNATKRGLKQPDQFHNITEHGIDWAKQHRQNTIIAGVVLVLVVLGAVGGYSLFESRTTAASTAFGAAMQTYQTPLVTPGQPLPPGMKAYNSASERAKAANDAFSAVASKYGMTQPGKLALYFTGLTYMEEGQNASAEDTLKKVAGGWNSDVAALGKLALAQLYQQTGRDAQAADIYNQLSSGKGTTTVPTTLAQLQLAEMYSSEGKADKAKEIYAKLKDQDKDAKGKAGPAGSIAADKLNPKAAQEQ